MCRPKRQVSSVRSRQSLSYRKGLVAPPEGVISWKRGERRGGGRGRAAGLGGGGRCGLRAMRGELGAGEEGLGSGEVTGGMAGVKACVGVVMGGGECSWWSSRKEVSGIPTC